MRTLPSTSRYLRQRHLSSITNVELLHLRIYQKSSTLPLCQTSEAPLEHSLQWVRFYSFAPLCYHPRINLYYTVWVFHRIIFIKLCFSSMNYPTLKSTMRNCYEKFFLSTISFYVSLQQSWEKFPLNFKVRASPQAVMSYMDDVNQSICHNSIFVLTHQEKGLIWCPTFRSMRILEYIFLFSFLVAPFYYSSLFSFTLSFIFSVIVVYVL